MSSQGGSSGGKPRKSQIHAKPHRPRGRERRTKPQGGIHPFNSSKPASMTGAPAQ